MVPRKVGGPWGCRNIGPATQHCVARLLIDGTLTMPEIAKVLRSKGVTYENVRTVKRCLQTLHHEAKAS